MKKRFLALVTAVILLVPFAPVQAFAADSYGQYGFTEVKTQSADGGTYHLLEHSDTGAQVVWLDNGSETREFAIGFRTPPEDSKGANHVLEHSLLCGSEQYPLNDLMHILQNSSVAQEINAYTSEDYTTYVFSTADEQDFYNLAGIYTTCVLFPRLRTEPNIFKQQGIRIEYADGKAQYNGIVYNELRLRNLDTAQNSLCNIVTIFLGLSVGCKAVAETFLTWDTIKIIILGLIAFMFSTIGGLLFGKVMYKLTGGKVNPLIGSAGVSAVPMAARVSQVEGQKANPANFLLMHAMGPNVAGVIGSAVAAGFFLKVFGA